MNRDLPNVSNLYEMSRMAKEFKALDCCIKNCVHFRKEIRLCTLLLKPFICSFVHSFRMKKKMIRGKFKTIASPYTCTTLQNGPNRIFLFYSNNNLYIVIHKITTSSENTFILVDGVLRWHNLNGISNEKKILVSFGVTTLKLYKTKLLPIEKRWCV